MCNISSLRTIFHIILLIIFYDIARLRLYYPSFKYSLMFYYKAKRKRLKEIYLMEDIFRCPILFGGATLALTELIMILLI